MSWLDSGKVAAADVNDSFLVAQDCCSPNPQTPLAQAPKFKWIIGFAFGPSLDLDQLPLESIAHLTTLISKSRGRALGPGLVRLCICGPWPVGRRLGSLPGRAQR
jgi:hypothetical protein